MDRRNRRRRDRVREVAMKTNSSDLPAKLDSKPKDEGSVADLVHSNLGIHTNFTVKPPLPECVESGSVSLAHFIAISYGFCGSDLVGEQYSLYLSILMHHYLDPRTGHELKNRTRKHLTQEEPVTLPNLLTKTKNDLETHVKKAVQKTVDTLKTRYSTLRRYRNTDINQDGITKVSLCNDEVGINKSSGTSLFTKCSIKDRKTVSDVWSLTYRLDDLKQTVDGVVLNLSRNIRYHFGVETSINHTQQLKVGTTLDIEINMTYFINGKLDSVTFKCKQRGKRKSSWRDDYYWHESTATYELKSSGLLEQTSVSLDYETPKVVTLPKRVGKAGFGNSLVFSINTNDQDYGFVIDPFVDHYKFITSIYKGILEKEIKKK